MNLPPIGYALKQADQAISEYSNAQLQTVGLSRLQWQVLNVISDNSNTTKGFIAEQEVADLLGKLRSNHFIEDDGGKITLSDTGEKKLEEAGKVQAGVRQKLMEGVTEADYVTTIQTLQQITQNLSPKEHME